MTRSTIRAVRFHGLDKGICIDEVPYPEPRAGEVTVRVGACGICGSDLHFLDGIPVPGGIPLTLGHEPAGVIDAIGEGVEGWSLDDRVAITLGSGCGTCPTCTTGHPNACPFLIAPGLHIDGAYADMIRVPATTLVRVPDEVSLVAAGVATDCVGTPYHGLKCRAQLQPGERVAVIGCGGLGTQAVAMAKLLGASEIVAVDLSQAALDHAVKAGATHTVLAKPGEDPSSDIRSAVGYGVTLAVECVGRPETVAAGMGALAPGGRVLVIGVGMMPPPITVPSALFTMWEYSVIGTFASHKEDLEEVLRLQAEGAIDIESHISHRFSLEEIPEGLEMLQTKRDDPQRMVMEIPL